MKLKLSTSNSALKTISIVMPVYNEEKTLPIIIDAVKKSDTRGLKKEIIVVDDGSTDRTAAVASTLKGIRFINQKKNRGKGAAIRTGFLSATGDIVLIQDSDLEYSPVDYPKLIDPFFTFHADVVYGSRFKGSDATRVIYFTHFLANHFLTFYSNLWTNINLTDMECGYKAFRRWVVDAIKHRLVSNRFGIEPELTARVAHLPSVKFYEVGIHYQGRTYEEGKKIGVVDGIKALLQITWFNLTSKLSR